jgi:renalase
MPAETPQDWRRLDVQRAGARGAPPRIAVVGAGLAGLACADELARDGFAVTVFDKGRAAGGRLATRRVGAHTFDLGAQYFTVRDSRFAEQVERWRRAGACAPWPGTVVAFDEPDALPRPTSVVQRLVGTPDMSALARSLAQTVQLRASHRVELLRRDGAGVELRGTIAAAGVTLASAPGESESAESLGTFDAVLVTTPPSQAATLVAPVSAALAERAANVAFAPCLAVGITVGPRERATLRQLRWDAAFIGSALAPSTSPLAWAARDSSKPGRPPGERWVAHANACWTAQTAAQDNAQSVAAMLAELGRLLRVSALQPELTVSRTWMLARAVEPLQRGALWDEGEARVALGGDWCSGGRIEDAFLSGLALADRARSWFA